LICSRLSLIDSRAFLAIDIHLGLHIPRTIEIRPMKVYAVAIDYRAPVLAEVSSVHDDRPPNTRASCSLDKADPRTDIVHPVVAERDSVRSPTVTDKDSVLMNWENHKPGCKEPPAIGEGPGEVWYHVASERDPNAHTKMRCWG
jgi:hypothetical protein